VNSFPCLEYNLQLPSSSTIAKHLTPSNFLEAYQVSFQSTNLGLYELAKATLNSGIKLGITLLITDSDALNSIFLSIDAQPTTDENMMYQIPDKSEPYNIHLMNIYLTSLLKKHLNDREYEVLRMSYGLDCDKHSAKEIAAKLKIEGPSSYVRISELKRQAVNKLIENVDHSQVLDYL